MHASELEIVWPLTGGAGEASVDLVRGAGRLWVLKRHRPEALEAERRFQRLLADHGLPSLATPDCEGLAPDQLLLEYVPDSPTLGRAPSLDHCRAWGAAIGGLHGVASTQADLAAWREALATRTREALARQRLARQRLPGGDLPPALLDRAEAALAALSAFAPRRLVPIHGDLHLNNALVRADGIVLFDTSAGLAFAPAVFDLALIFSEAFPGALYGADRPGDDARLAAFLEGYGALPPEERPWLDHLVLLRALERYPSPFVPELRAILELALDRAAASPRPSSRHPRPRA